MYSGKIRAGISEDRAGTSEYRAGASEDRAGVSENRAIAKKVVPTTRKVHHSASANVTAAGKLPANASVSFSIRSASGAAANVASFVRFMHRAGAGEYRAGGSE